MVGEDGLPISAAHKAIYRHLDECRDEMVAHIDNVMSKHVQVTHKELMLRTESIAQHLQDRVAIEEIANMALGSPRSELRGGGRNNDGWDTIIRENRAKIDELHDKLGNGQRLKMQLDWKQTATAIAFILFTVAKQIGLF